MFDANAVNEPTVEPENGGYRTRELGPMREGVPPESGSGVGFWHSLTFEDLARAQGVQPVQRLEDIMGGWPEDEREDGFEEAIHAMRQEDLRREQSQ